jgi:hypothetical protein
MTMPEIIELPTGTANAPVRINPMTTQRLAAAAAANAPARPWQPAPLTPPPHPRVVELTAEADAVRAAVAAESARADSLTTAAKIVGQRIASLEREKTEMLNRIASVEGRDCKAELARNRARIHQLYGKTSLSGPEIYDLNTSTQSLSWLPLLERELLALAKALRARLAAIETELGEITKGESK